MMPDFVTKNEKRKAESRQSARATAAAGPPAAAGRAAGPPANRTLFHCDNLEVLRGINSATIDLIATDPPFNKNQDFHATPDSLAKGAKFEDRWSWDRDVHQEWVDAIKDDWPAVWAVIDSTRVAAGEDMAAFLCWLGVRLMECHRVLKDTGSLYLHIDHTAHAYAKCLLDGIFGRRNFRNEIVWKRATAKKGTTKKFGVVHDAILYYVKTQSAPYTTVYIDHDPEYINRAYRHKDRRGRYRVGDLTGAGATQGSSSQPWRGIAVKEGKHWVCPRTWPDGLTIPSGWDSWTTQAKLDYMDKMDLIHWPEKGKVPGFKRYLSTTEGRAMTDLVTDVSQLEANDKEDVGYPTQKPLSLYERIIKASSKPGDMVLDPFCGCATTPVAAERLGRHWIGIDIWAGAYQMVLDRLEQENLKVGAGASPRLSFGEVHYTTTPPQRTDYDETPSAPDLRLRAQRAPEPWERLSREDMTRILAAAQAHANGEGVICAGCGRILEVEFMELDHITPKSGRGANNILNRILLCRPCNGRKGNHLTLPGLLRENKRPTVRWMRNEALARLAWDNAEKRANWVRDNFGSEEYRSFMAGL